MNNRISADPILVLATGPMPYSQGLGAGYELYPLTVLRPADGGAEAETVPDDIAGKVRAIAAAGPRKITASLIKQLPALEIIANFGAGYDRVDVAAATDRGIVVTNTPDVLTEEVADFTIGLLIATVRRIADADRFVRSGAWAAGTPFPLSASLRGRRIGLVGLGRIGQAVARRCTGMGLEIAYTARTARPETGYVHYPDALSLARAVDALIVIVPGDASTKGMIGAAEIAALGPDGVLLNMARGTVVDETALIDALEGGRLLAAGLDVFANEPTVPERLLALPNVVLSPHVGSATRTTRDAMGNLVLANIRNWFSGAGALTPVNRIAAE